MKTKEAILQEIKCSETMINVAVKSFAKTITKYNGKVLNKRFIKSIKDDAYINGIVFYLKDNRLDLFNNIDRCFKDGNNFSYVDYDTMSFPILLVDSRIDAEKTIEAFNVLIDREKELNAKRLGSIDKINDANNEYNNICELIKAYNNKYEYFIRKSFERVY